MAAALLVQVQLRAGTAERTCWVPQDKPFKEGDRITLKNSEDPDQQWDVVQVGSPRLPSDIKRGWSNNI